MDDLESITNIDNTPTKEDVFKHLLFTSSLLKENNIKHFILYGTLLGAIREKDIISYDYDFDMGIFYEDYSKVYELNSLITDTRYKFEYTKGTVYKLSNFKDREYLWRVSLKVVYDGDAVGDLFIYKRCDDGFIRRYDPKDKIYFYPNSTFPYFLVEQLEELSINNASFPAPRHPEILVRYYYGPMWKTPIKSASQNGENHPDYDYYGNFKYSNLKLFTDHLRETHNIDLKPDFGFDNINYFFPLEQYDWIKDNEVNDS